MNYANLDILSQIVVYFSAIDVHNPAKVLIFRLFDNQW